MASSSTFLQTFLARVNDPEITSRPMMGEYVLYYRGKVIGGIYDDRLLIKNIPQARALLPQAPEAIPYPGAKAMLQLDPTDPLLPLAELLDVLYAELPLPKKRKPKP